MVGKVREATKNEDWEDRGNEEEKVCGNQACIGRESEWKECLQKQKKRGSVEVGEEREKGSKGGGSQWI